MPKSTIRNPVTRASEHVRTSIFNNNFNMFVIYSADNLNNSSLSAEKKKHDVL